MLDYIITADHIAARDGYPNHRARLRGMFARMSAKYRNIKFDEREHGKPVKAFIDFGRWSARCECGGSEYVTYADPVFYCFSCCNRETGGRLRPVTFPARRDVIEQLVLERPVDDRRGLTDDERALNARPLVGVQENGQALPLSRSWTPDESITDLRRQNKAVEAYKKAQGE